MGKKSFVSVPNFSTSDPKIIEQLLACFQSHADLKLLDFSSDQDHNRTVITVQGSSKILICALVNALQISVQKIDLRTHIGAHPRIGALDVLPIVPTKNTTLKEADTVAKQLALACNLAIPDLPIIFYEFSASTPQNRNLDTIRQNEWQELNEKLHAGLQVDLGPNRLHPTAGALVIGARKPLIAFNVNLQTSDVTIAKKIAQKIRESSGGLPGVKAIGLYLNSTRQAQVSMNLVDYTKTNIDTVYLAISKYAKHYGVALAHSEIIGALPEDALTQAFAHFINLDNSQIKTIKD